MLFNWRFIHSALPTSREATRRGPQVQQKLQEVKHAGGTHAVMPVTFKREEGDRTFEVLF